MENKEMSNININEVIEIPDNGILTSRTGNSRATGDTIVNNFRTGYKVQAVWKVNSQNVANNTSNVTVQVQLCSTGSSYTISSSATKNGSVTINGTTYSFTFSAGLSGNQTKTVYTKTLDITHNSDGTKSFSISASLGIAVTLSGTYWGTVTASGTASLNSIPRTSTMSLSASSIEAGKAITVNITRASSSFTHKVFYSFGSNTATISTNATTSASYTIPLSHLSVIPNSTSGTATISVDTYNGSTYIGSVSKNFTITAPSSIKPTISSLTATVVANGADTSYGYVKGKSKCKLTINGATGSQGSTIKSYSISGGDFSSSSSSFTTGALTKSGNIEFTATVTDSRGRKSDAKTVTINVLDYVNPNITNFAVIRCNSSGTASDEGTYLKITPTYTYSTLSGKNTITSKAEFKKTSTTTWTNAGAINSGASLVTGSNGIATDSSYDVKFTITDKFTNTSKTVIIPTAFVTMDIKKKGKGIAFGKTAETDNLLDVGMKAKFHNDIQILDNNMLKVSSSNTHSGIGYDSSSTDTYIANSVNNWLRLKADKTMTYAGHKVYTAYDKPTANDVGAYPKTGGEVSGQLLMTGNMSSTNMPHIRLNTSGDSNGFGDGQTHLGYRANDGKYYHYFRGTGAMNINCTAGTNVTNNLAVSGSISGSKGLSTAHSINIGAYEDTFRSVNCKRLLGSQKYESRYGVTYNGVKQQSSNASVDMWGGVIEAYDANAGSAKRRYLFSNTGFYPLNDNASYLGASSHRWQTAYCTEGKFYTSTKSFKTNIKPIDKPLEELTVFSTEKNKRNIRSPKEYILDAIKETPMTLYNYKSRMNNDRTSENVTDNSMFVGFIADDLKTNHPEFFEMIGESGIQEREILDEEGNPTGETYEEMQYDISDISVLGALWTGLQDALITNEQQEKKIENLESQVENLTNELKQIKDMLSKIA